MNWTSARSSRAPAPQDTAKRAPEILAARSKSRMPSAGPRSQCAFGVEVEAAAARPRGAPRTLADASRPDGHARVGQVREPRAGPRAGAPRSPARRASRALISSETPFISALRAEASSRALPRRAISSPARRCRWRSCSTCCRIVAALGVERPGVARRRTPAVARPAPRADEHRLDTRSRFSTTNLRSSIGPSETARRRHRPVLVIAS